MTRVRRHPRLAAAAAFGLLAIAVELLGRSLTERIDVGKHVAAPSYAHAGYYPFLLLGVKLGIALLLARLAWRFTRARATARAGRRVLGQLERMRATPPRLRLTLSPRLWAGSFVLTSAVYVVQADAEGIARGRWALFGPLLHTSALSVFAVLSVLVAVLWAAVSGWLNDYETYAQETLARARRLVGDSHATAPSEREDIPPRFLFGLAFESRPPPVPA